MHPMPLRRQGDRSDLQGHVPAPGRRIPRDLRGARHEHTATPNSAGSGGGLENVKLVRLKSSQTTLHSKSIRGKAALRIDARGPAYNPGIPSSTCRHASHQGISKWEVVARGDVAEVQAALARILR